MHCQFDKFDKFIEEKQNTFYEKNKRQNITTTLSVMQRTEYASNMYIHGLYTAWTI